MIINNQKGDVVEVIGEETAHKATINTGQIAKLQYILTEGLYKDAASATIVELSNNGVDSIVESGKDAILNPVIVELKNLDGKYSISIKDNGVGMNKRFFEDFFMNLLSSTKEDRNDMIGNFGLGGKSWASLKRAVTFTIVQNGIKCKYLCYKGEELIDYDLILETETDEEDGVLFEMPLNNYSEYQDFKNKAKQKLAYYDTVVLIIDGTVWDNKIYRNDLFQYNIESPYNTMHLCLKDVVYEIDWDKLKIDPIYLPIALRFSLTDGIIPTPSRESYLNSKETLELIHKRIIEVSDYLINLYNESIKEPISFWKGFDNIKSSHKYLQLQDKKMDIFDLNEYSTIPLEEVKIIGMELKSPEWYKLRCYELFQAFEVKAEYTRGIWKTSRIYGGVDYKFRNKYKIVLVNKIFGNVKEYVKEEAGYNLYVEEVKHNLFWYRKNILVDIPKDQWRKHIIEWQNIIELLKKDFCLDYRDVENTEEYKEWLLKRKEYAKENRIDNPGNYKTLNKQEGEVTISYPRTSLNGGGKVFEKNTYKIESLYKTKQVVIVFTEAEKEIASQLAQLVVKEKVAIIGIREFNKIKHIRQFKLFKNFMEDNKPFRRLATAILAERMLEEYSVLFKNSRDVIQKCLLPLEQKIQVISTYKFANSKGVKSEVATIILELAKDKNLWDQEYFAIIKDVEKSLSVFDFIKYITVPSRWDEKSIKEVNTFINQMLLFKKKYHNQLENFELVYKEPEILEELDNEETI